MTRTHWLRLEEAFHGALAHPTAERSCYLRQACAGDEALERETRALLAEHARAGSFIEPATPDPAGTRIGSYTLVRIIGAGGMGTVYEATQDHPRRSVALKVVRGALGSRGAVRRFEEEAAILARLRHPGIAQVYEAGTHDDGGGAAPYFAMELVPDAKPIVAFADAAALSLRARIELFLSVCDAVAHGHQRAVIHRDLKPGNILVDGEGRVKVIDFGVARTLEPGGAHVTEAGQVVGTIAYMSPEQCAGASADADVRSDVYSLGVILYELLCGARPHNVDTKPLADAARIVREGAIRRPSQMRPALRGDVEVILLRALEQDPPRRYQSVTDLAADLQRFLRQEPILARAPSFVYHAGKFVRRHRALVAATAAVIVTLAVATVVSVSFALNARRQATRAEQALTRAQRVSTFLQGALGAANPFIPSAAPPELLASDFDPWADWRAGPWPFAGKPGQAASVLDLLRAAAARLDNDFADDPVALGQLADILGWTMFCLRDMDAGEPLLRRAVALRRSALGDDDPQTIRSTLHLAEFLDNRGGLTEAEDLFRSALVSCRRAFGPHDSRALQVARSLAHNLAFLQFRSAEAVSLLEDCVRDVESLPPAHQPAAHQLASYLATILIDTPRADHAEALARHSVQRLTSLVGAADIRTAAALDALTDVLLSQPGRAGDAVASASTAADVLGSWFGEQSMQSARAQARLAMTLHQAGRWARAAEVWAKVAGLYERVLGPQDFETLRVQGEWARSLLQTGEHPDEAARLALAASTGLDRLYNAPSSYALMYAILHAEALWAGGQRAGALERLDACIAVLHANREKDWTPLLIGALTKRGGWLLDLGRAADARAPLQEALDLTHDADQRVQIERLLNRASRP